MNPLNSDYCTGCLKLLPASLLQHCRCDRYLSHAHPEAVWCSGCYEASHAQEPDPMDLAKEVRSGDL